MLKTQARLRDTAANLLAEGRVDIVLGWEEGSLPFTTRPLFARRPEEAERLAWNSNCTNNLAVYLPRLFKRPARPKPEYRPPRVGLVARGCDARSALGQIKENKFARSNLTIIGMACPGMLDAGLVREALGGDRALDCRWEGGADLEVIAARSRVVPVERETVLLAACRACICPQYADADVTIEGEARAPAAPQYDRIEARAALTAAERWQAFESETAKCIRCNACRQACPNCYCPTCFADLKTPQWIGTGHDITDRMAYHIGRILHQAGRCVSCDACLRACPMGIDLRVFTQWMVKDVEGLFGFAAGMTDEAPPLTTFDPHDDDLSMAALDKKRDSQ